MRYIPNNKVKSNLYTNGNEYFLDNKPYVGYYHILYDGSAYTGKNQYENNIRLLFKTNNNTSEINENNILNIKDEENNSYYNKISDSETSEYKKVITTETNLPTSKDYENGFYKRYFCKKINSNTFYEISEETYIKLIEKNKEYIHFLYIPFDLIWKIKGERNEVYESNVKNINYSEQRYGILGFKKFMNNPLEFYLESK